MCSSTVKRSEWCAEIIFYFDFPHFFLQQNTEQRELDNDSTMISLMIMFMRLQQLYLTVIGWALSQSNEAIHVFDDF